MCPITPLSLVSLPFPLILLASWNIAWGNGRRGVVRDNGPVVGYWVQGPGGVVVQSGYRGPRS